MNEKFTGKMRDLSHKMVAMPYVENGKNFDLALDISRETVQARMHTDAVLGAVLNAAKEGQRIIVCAGCIASAVQALRDYADTLDALLETAEPVPDEETKGGA